MEKISFDAQKQEVTVTPDPVIIKAADYIADLAQKRDLHTSNVSALQDQKQHDTDAYLARQADFDAKIAEAQAKLDEATATLNTVNVSLTITSSQDQAAVIG